MPQISGGTPRDREKKNTLELLEYSCSKELYDSLPFIQNQLGGVRSYHRMDKLAPVSPSVAVSPAIRAKKAAVLILIMKYDTDPKAVEMDGSDAEIICGEWQTGSISQNVSMEEYNVVLPCVLLLTLRAEIQGVDQTLPSSK